MNDVTDKNVSEDSEILTAFLESLKPKWYAYDFLVDDNFSYYIISRPQDNKMGVISKDWWFNGDWFWPNEYWFNWIDTQEMGWDTFIEFWDDRWWLICKLQDGKILLWEKQEVNIGDLVNAALAGIWGRLN